MGQENNPTNNQNNRGEKKSNRNEGLSDAEVERLKKEAAIAKKSCASKIREALHSYKRTEKDTPEKEKAARDSMLREIQEFIDDLAAFGEGLEGKKLSGTKTQIEKRTEKYYKAFRLDEDSTYKTLEKEFPETLRQAAVQSLQNLQQEQRSVLRRANDLQAKIYERRKTGEKLRDDEKVANGLEARNIVADMERLKATLAELKDGKTEIKLDTTEGGVQQRMVSDIEAQIEKFEKEKFKEEIEAALQKPPMNVDKKLEEFEATIKSIREELKAFEKEVEDRIKEKQELNDDDKKELTSNLEFINAKIDIFLEETTAFQKQHQSYKLIKRVKTTIPIGLLSGVEKQKYERSAMGSVYLQDYSKKILDRIKNGKREVDSKEQLTTVNKSVSRINEIEKQMKADIDELKPGKKLSDSKKGLHATLLEAELVDIEEMEADANNLEDTDLRKEAILRLIQKQKERIEKLLEKLEKERTITEKEVKEKLEEIGKVVAEYESKILEIKLKTRDAQIQMDANREAADEKKSFAARFGSALASPFRRKAGTELSYHDQKPVSENVNENKDEIAELKEMIEKMPSSTDKEIQLKTKLMKKARRMNRRLSSAKWRHMFLLPAGERMKYVGYKTTESMMGLFDYAF